MDDTISLTDEHDMNDPSIEVIELSSDVEGDTKEAEENEDDGDADDDGEEEEEEYDGSGSVDNSEDEISSGHGSSPINQSTNSRPKRSVCKKSDGSSSNECIIIDEDNSSTPGLPAITSTVENEETSEDEDETFLSTNSHNLEKGLETTPNLKDQSAADTTTASTPASVTQQQRYTSPDVSAIEAEVPMELQVMGEDYCEECLKTLSRSEETMLTSSTSSGSINSQPSMLKQLFRRSRKNPLPSYNSAKNFDPKKHLMKSDGEEEEDDDLQVDKESSEKNIKKLQSFNSLSPMTYTKMSCYSISSSVDEEITTTTNETAVERVRTFESYLNDPKYQPKVVIKRMSRKSILEYRKKLKAESNLNLLVIVPSKRKSSLTAATDDSNDTYPGISKAKKRHLPILLNSDNDSNDAVNEHGNKLLLKIKRNGDGKITGYNSTISCSEDDVPDKQQIDSATIKSNSSITISSNAVAVPIKSAITDKATAEATKPKQASRGKDLNLLKSSLTSGIEVELALPSKTTIEKEKKSTSKKPVVEMKKAKSSTAVMTTQLNVQCAKTTAAPVNEKQQTSSKTLFKIPRLATSAAAVATATTAKQPSAIRQQPVALEPPPSRLASVSGAKRVRPKEKTAITDKNRQKNGPGSKKLPAPTAQQGLKKPTTRLTTQIEQRKSQAKEAASLSCVALRPSSTIGLELLFGKIYYQSINDIHIDTKMFNLINANAYYNRKYDYGLSFMSLSDSEKVHLLKLQRKTRRVNKLEIFAIEFNKKFVNGKDIEINMNTIQLHPCLDADENWIINSSEKLNMVESFCTYKKMMELLDSPFRTYEVLQDEDFGSVNARVTFENNGAVCGVDKEPCASVLDILHKKYEDLDWIKGSLNNHVVMSTVHNHAEERDNSLSLGSSDSSNDLSDFVEKRKLVDDKDFWDEVQIRCVYTRANQQPSAYDLIRDKTTRNYAERNVRPPTVSNCPNGRFSSKTRFQPTENQPVINRGSSAYVEVFRPVGVSNAREFESRFTYYNSKFNLNMRPEDVSIQNSSFFYNRNCDYNNNEPLSDNNNNYNQNYMCSP